MGLVKIYHGTTVENLRSIQANGLRKGTFVTPDLLTAEAFADARAKWNRMAAVLLVITIDAKLVGPVTTDRRGRLEAQLLATVRRGLVVAARDQLCAG